MTVACSAWQGRRVAIVLGALAPGSREHVMFALAERLAAAGAKVDFVMPSPEPSTSSPTFEGGIDHVDVSSYLTRALPNVLRLAFAPKSIAAYLQKSPPDVVLTLSIPPGLATLAGRRLAGTATPVVIRQSNVIRIEGSPIYGHIDRRWRDRMIPRLYPDADAVIAVSEGVADNLGHLLHDGAPPIHAIANGIPVERIDRLGRAPTPHPWLEDGGPPVVLAVGRLVGQKDYPTLLRAFARLREKRPARLIVLGDGPKRRMIESLRAELSLEAMVDLPGRTDNPFAYLSRASLYVLSSTFEGMPNALIEALACGCPAVSTDCPSGPSEILDGGEYGELVPIGDVAALCQAMDAALSAPPPCERQCERGRVFSADRTIEAYISVLDELCEHREQPAYSAAIA